MGRSSDGSIQTKMSLIRGCFGYCNNSKKSADEASKDNKGLPTIHRKVKCTQRNDVSDTAVCRSKKAKQRILSRTEENTRWRLFKVTASAFFLRNVNVDRQYFKALKTEGLLMTVVSSVKYPVLNIAWFFTDGELTNRHQSFHRSFQKSNWDIVICAGITEEMKTNFNYDKINEPILDGIPCSYWLSAIEPTIPMILDLFSRRHKKTNLSRLRVFDGLYDELMTRHGDTFLEQLDPDMYGPHQVLVNRRHTTPFPTMELGAAATLVHNAIVSREYQFQEPFRSRRPNHRSRCTRRPRPPPNSGHGMMPVIIPEDSGDSQASTAPTLVSTPGYQDMMIDRDPHWYIPVILQLAAFSQLQLPDVEESSDDDVACCSGMAATSQQLQTVSNEGFDQIIAGCSSTDIDNSPLHPPGINEDNPDVAIAGCSWMCTEPYSTDYNVILCNDKASSRSNVEIKSSDNSFRTEDQFLAWKSYSLSAGSGFLNHKSEIDDVFCVEENTGERLETLHEIVEEGNINEYVDFILESAVLSLSPIQVSAEEHSELSPRHLDAVDIREPIQTAFSQSPTCMTYGSSVVCTSTHDMEKQTEPYTGVPCPDNYHDECVVDQMAVINVNQSASHCGHTDYRDKCLNNLNQTGHMFHLDQHSYKQTVLAVQGEEVVPETDRLNRDLAILNVNQSALFLHTHHRLRNRCGYSPDTWLYDEYEHDYRPARLRPNEKTIHAWKASVKTYIRGMPEAHICHPSEPAIFRIFDGSHGPVARRFFVHCATECLQEIDEKEPWRWIPTKQQTCEYRNRSQLSPFGPEIAYKKHKLMFEKSKGKYVIIAEHERRNSTKEKFLKHARKKRKNKQRDVSQIPKSSEKTEMFRPNDEVNETMDVLRGNQTTIKTDVKENGVYRSHSRRYESKCRITSPGKCVTTERTPSTCGVKNNDHGINVVIPSSEKESPEGMLKRQKQQQTSAGTDEKLTKDIEVALDDQHGIGQASSAMSCGYAVNPDKPRENTVAGGRSITYPKQDDVEESTSCSNRKQQSQSTSTKKTFKGSVQGTTTNIGISTKEQTCNRRRSITCVRECEREKSINTQSSASNEEMRDTYNCINFEDDSYTNKKDISHEILSSLSRSQRRRDGDKKYTSSDNDADLSSSDCNEVPRRKSKVRYKKKRNVSAQRKETTDGAGTGFDNPGVRKCYLSRESKQILATLQQHDTSNNVPYDEGSFSEKDSCEFTSVCNETMTSLNVNTSQVSVGCIKDQSNETVVWEFSETDMRQSDCKEEIDEDSDTDYTDFCPSCTSLRFQRKSDSKDIVNKEDIDFSEEEMLESNDSYWTKDFSYDTDESSPDSLLGDEGYLMVNMSDTFHSESVTSSSSESFTNQYMVRSSLSENTLGSRSFCSSEYSSVHKDDCTTTKSPPLCYKSTGFYFYQKSDTSLHSQPSKSTSLVDNSSTYGILDSNRIVSGGNSNGETGQSNIEHSRIENKRNNDPSQDPIQSSSMEVNYRTSGQSSINNKNVVTAQLNGTPRSFDPTDVSHGSFAEIQEQGESSSNNEERPVNLREHHFRRHHDVGDRTTSVDDVRRHRESRRQRGILQYQWNGIYALSQMYENRVGHRIRRYRIWLRAWLDRRRQWLQRNN